jgi:hypothetical protein
MGLMRRFVALLLAGLIAWAPTSSQAVLKGSGGQSPAAVAITGGTITGITDLAVADGGTGASTAQAAAQNLGVPWMLSKAGIPFIKAPTGTMANNCAVTFGTALPRIYANGAWVWYPAGAVAAGTPATASWLWTVMSSTTVGTCYNSTYSTGTPTIGTTTAYATTGPGAFAGDTGEVTTITISMPAGSMGLNGLLEWLINFSTVSNANSKTVKFKFGGTTYTSEIVASLGRQLLPRLRAEHGGCERADRRPRGDHFTRGRRQQLGRERDFRHRHDRRRGVPHRDDHGDDGHGLRRA